jgi:hypothetical protein
MVERAAGWLLNKTDPRQRAAERFVDLCRKNPAAGSALAKEAFRLALTAGGVDPETCRRFKLK